MRPGPPGTSAAGRTRAAGPDVARRATLHLIALASLLAARVASGADCNANGTPDIEEVRSGALPDCNRNWVPDSCDIQGVNQGLALQRRHRLPGAVSEVLAEDIDGDGEADLAASDRDTALLHVLWNDGGGQFSESRESDVLMGVAAQELAAGDFDGDGSKDFVLGSPQGVIVLLQAPGRRFHARGTIVSIVPGKRQSPAPGDFDGDGDLDLAVTVPFGVRVLSNEGTGHLTPLDAQPLGSSPREIIAANVDGDGALDIVTLNDSVGGLAVNVSVLANKWNGAFDTARNYATANGADTFLGGDFDGDSDLDLATGSRGGKSIYVMMGDGAGRFLDSLDLHANVPVTDLAGADLDQDGDTDLAAAAGSLGALAGVHLYLNQERGAFTPIPHFEIWAFVLAVADLDGDGIPQVIVHDVASEALTVLERASIPYSTDCNSSTVPDECELEANDCNGNGFIDSCDLASGRSIDCDGNGRPDECQLDCNENGIPDVCELISEAEDCNANGVPDRCDIFPTFEFRSESIPFQFPAARLLSHRDLDRDGAGDLLVVLDSGNLLVFWGSGAHPGFSEPTPFFGAFLVSDHAVRDMDSDGDDDIVLASVNGIAIIEGRGARSFGPGKFPMIDIGGVPSLVAADLDDDSDIDLSAPTSEEALMIVENREEGMLPPRRIAQEDLMGPTLEAADLDGDGRIDLAGNNHPEFLAIRWNAPGFDFEKTTRVRMGGYIRSVAPADLDMDGDLDIALANAFHLFTVINLGERAFSGRTVPESVRGFENVVAEDLDADGHLDLLARIGQSAVLLRNQGDGSFDPLREIISQESIIGPVAADLDASGTIDLAFLRTLFCFECAEPRTSRLVLVWNFSKPPASQDQDRNGLPDECQRPFHRGDANGDGEMNLTDAIITLGHLFQGVDGPGCLEAADTSNNGGIEITDAIITLDFLFRGGPPPAPPGPPPDPCGVDIDAPGSAGDLGCESYERCSGI